MSLTCHKCKHKWDESIAPGQTVVMCPECFETVPLVIATGQMQSHAPGHAHPDPAGHEARQVAHRPERTVVNPAPDTVASPHGFATQPPQARQAPTPQPEAPRPAPKPAQTPGAQPVQPARSTQPADQPAQPASQPAPQRPPRPASAAGPSTVANSPHTVHDTPTGTVVTPKGALSGDTPVPQTPPKSSRPSSTGSGTPSNLKNLIGRTIDGYVIQKQLGQGGMGAVFLARQISLERDVALKTLAPKLTNNKEFVARFTREALSAAQLNHHNIIQVYDVGSADDLHYITMEFVRGESLAQTIKRDGRLQVDDAAAYVLQAARGLKYAHDQGIVHRDIKPDNLMLNEHGIIKIADMGLAKRIGASEERVSGSVIRDVPDDGLTHADVAMGTPAYMAPEQARDAGSAGAQADQYSLGCTLYYLCAGRAPYSGTTAFELISKHLKEPITPLEAHIQSVPPALSVILNRMLEKDPKKRFSNMGEVVRVLESYLGVETDKGPYTPREHHLAVLEHSQKEYYAAPSLKKRKFATIGFLALMPVLILGALLGGSFALAGGFLGLLALAPLANFIIDGLQSKIYLFRRVRSVFFGMPVASWVKTIGGAVIALVVLLLLGWLVWWFAFALLAVGLAFAYRKFVAAPLREERQPAIDKTQAMLKELRVRGVAEEALYDFVCRFSGMQWEEFFEEFFGYEPMILARAKWGKADKVKPRKRHATWRDPLARWLDGVELARQEARNRKTLVHSEKERLKAQGVDEQKAEEQAKFATTKIMEKGLLAAVEKDDQRKQKIDHYFEGAKRKGSGKSLPGVVFFCARAALAVALILAGGASFGKSWGLPTDAISGIFDSIGLSNWGAGATFWGMVAGAALALTLVKRSVFPAILVFTGALFLAGLQLVVNAAGQPMLTMVTGFYFAMGLVAAGVFFMFFGSKR